MPQDAATQNPHEKPVLSGAEGAGCLQLAPSPSSDWILSGSLFLQDRPGELAEVSSVIAGHQSNIEKFYYNRSENANLVRITTRVATGRSAGALAEAFRARGYLEPPPEEAKDKAEITELGGLLRIKVNLEDRPGTLAAFATVLREHRANVIFMSYDGEQAPRRRRDGHGDGVAGRGLGPFAGPEQPRLSLSRRMAGS